MNSFRQMWPPDIPARIYVEGDADRRLQPRFEKRNFNLELPEAVQFIRKHEHRPKPSQSYIWDATKFCRKVFAIHHAAVTDPIPCDRLLWLDADTVTHEPVTEEWLDSLQPPESYLTYLGRNGTYSEAGFLSFNTQHPHHEEFMTRYRYWYTSGLLFTALKRGWTDCHVLDMVREQMEREEKGGKQKITCTDLSPRIPPEHRKRLGHVFINSRLGEKMDHKKGRRKHKTQWRRLLSEDFWIERSEPYWKQEGVEQ